MCPYLRGASGAGPGREAADRCSRPCRKQGPGLAPEARQLLGAQTMSIGEVLLQLGELVLLLALCILAAKVVIDYS